MTDNTAVELTKSDEFSNYASAMAWPIIAFAGVQWTLTTWYAQWKYAQRRRRRFRPQLPHKLSVFVVGGQAGQVIEMLRDYGISCQILGSMICVENGVKGMALSFLVSATQWEMADAILFQNQGDYIVTSAPGSKRGATFGQPWGVGSKARSFDEAINGALGRVFANERKTAKLGKTYR